MTKLEELMVTAEAASAVAYDAAKVVKDVVAAWHAADAAKTAAWDAFLTELEQQEETSDDKT
jgi:hypothetical protein